MTLQKDCCIRKFLIIASLLILASGCDIVDEFLASEDKTDLTEEQEQALATVLTLQNDASNIMDNLFNSGIDTLIVIDSLANFFLSDTSIQSIWADSEGVAVEYNNGISGGIFIRRYNPPISSIAKPSNLINYSPNQENILGKVNNITLSPIEKKSIYFDGAYSQFKEYNDQIINTANAGFSQIGIEPFVTYLDNKASIDILSTLDQYGIVHLTGHGWHRYSGKGFYKDKKETYFLTGEESEINTTYGELWSEILDKKVVIISHEKQNRYWVSSKFVSDRNDFTDKNVFIYDGFCYGWRENWQSELVQNAGADAFVGYYWAVWSNFEMEWAKKMYTAMCDTSLNNPMKIGTCISDITNGNRGFYDVGSLYDPFIIKLKSTGDQDYTFWEPEPPIIFSSLRFEYVLDTYWNPSCFASDAAANDYFDFDQYALLVSPINLSISKVGNNYSGSWNAIYDWGERWHTGSISFTLNDDKTKATTVNLNFSEVNPVTNAKSNEYNISLKDIDCNYSNTAISLSIKNKQTCSHLTIFDLWQDCWIYTNGAGISNLTSVGCSESETANTYYFIQIDLQQ